MDELIVLIGFLLVLAAFIAVAYTKSRSRRFYPSGKFFTVMGLFYMLLGYSTNNIILGRHSISPLFTLGLLFLAIGVMRLMIDRYLG